MEQLSGLDAAFVHQDSRRTPMHICAVLVYDTGDDGENALSLEQLKRLAAERLAQFPLFQRKLHRVVLGMDTPYWVDVEEREWDRQITQASLPEPGGWDAFQRLLGRLHGARMNMAYPLWEMHLVHDLYDMPGLPAHCQALVLKIHHSAIDGISMAGIINALHETREERPGSRKKQVSAPSQWELWARAHINTVNRQFKLAETMSNLLPGFLRARETRQKYSDLPPTHNGKAHFNARVSQGRSTGSVLMPMPEVLAIKRTVRRVTLNDIAMACVAGALREYLILHNKLPHKPLVGGIPINLREPGDDKSGGNKIATMPVGLATHLADPVERLRLIHRYAVAGKKQIDALGSGTVMDISDSLTPAVLAEGIRTMAWASQVAEFPVPFHTMISHVPGPPSELRLEGARLVIPLGLGPIRDNMGLFHIVSSSDTRMSLSFSACRRLLPDPDFYQQCLQNAFSSLLGRALSDTQVVR
jgi:WS/DGAT/MGAT family acyltransferase